MSARDDFRKHALREFQVRDALDVKDIQYPDLFILDNWSVEAGLTYLTGAYFIEEISDGSKINILVRTLDCCSYNSSKSEHITRAFINKYERMKTIWDSGLHDLFNSPKYYIEWAISKEIEIPWLDDAVKQGFYNPPLHNTEKPLMDKERDTLLVIIAALAKEAKLDINKTSKSGELIANLTQLIGAPIGATTIETHLKKIPQALESRAK